MAPDQDDDRGRRRRSEIDQSDAALTSSQAETAASRLETAASRVETSTARLETQKAHDESKIDSATVQEMIGEFTAKAEEIAQASREAQDEWVAAVAAENIIFKQRNAVLVKNNQTIKRMLAVALPVLLLLLVSAGYSQWRATYRTGPVIHETNRILDHTIEDKDRQLDDANTVISQAVQAITQMAAQITDLGGTPPQIILDPDRVEAGDTTVPVPADIEEAP